MNKNIIRIETAILGGGIAGLAAADRMTSKGGNPVVLEKEDVVGGICRSIYRNNFVFDLGGHRFLPHKKETAEYVSSLFVNNDEYCIRDRSSKIYLKGKYLEYPPELSDILKKLGVGTCFRCCYDSIFARLMHFLRKSPEISLEDWLINRFGKTLFDIYFGPYSLKLWGKKSTYISAEWAPQRISMPNIGAAIKNLFFKDRNTAKTYAKKFFYPSGGIGKIPGNMADNVSGKGGTVYTDHRVSSVAVDPEGFLLEAITSEGIRKLFVCEKIISTIPVTELISIMSPLAPQKVLDAANSLRFRSIRFLNIMLDTSKITQDTWLYIPETRYTFFRIQEFTNWHPDNSPPGKTSLTLEIACEKGDALWNMEGKELLDICIKDLREIGIDVEEKVIDCFSTYVEHAYPVYSLRYKEHLKTIYTYINGIDNLTICGRQGLFRYDNMDVAIESGFGAAEAISDGKFKDTFLRDATDKEYMEENVFMKTN